MIRMKDKGEFIWLFIYDIYGYFFAKDKMFIIDGGMNWADHVI